MTMPNDHGAEVLEFRRRDGHATRTRDFYFSLMPARDDWPSADVLPMAKPAEEVKS
jgi:hypothetical protein